MLKEKIKYRLSQKICFLVVFSLLSLIAYETPIKHDFLPTVETVAKKVDPRQLRCLAQNIFHEANGEPLHGQIAVARVVINRINHGFANTPCAVVYQVIENNDEKICQFSWTCDDIPDTISSHNAGYKNAEKIAYYVLAYDGFKNLIPGNVLFFHSIRVNPRWPYKKEVTIGNHVFYSKD